VLYKEWLNDTTIDKSWLETEGFFLGIPIDTDDAPVSEVMREAVYDYIKYQFGGKRLSLNDPERWGELYRARLLEVNGSFWKQMQMDTLTRIKDLVTADYTEYIQNFNRGVSDSVNTNTNSQSSNYTDSIEGSSNTNPVSTTTLNRESTKTTTTETPTTPNRTVTLNSTLAESTYADPIISDGVGEAGMPTLDTTHGDTAGGTWTLEGGKKTEVEVSTPTGDITIQQGKIEQENTQNANGSSLSSGTSKNENKSINASIGGQLREGHRDFNGYNLSASIEAVQKLLPLSFLRSALQSLFKFREEGDKLWL